jgi:hypothetical protein
MGKTDRSTANQISAESIEAQKGCDVENVQVQVVSIEGTGRFAGANIGNLPPVV